MNFQQLRIIRETVRRQFNLTEAARPRPSPRRRSLQHSRSTNGPTASSCPRGMDSNP